MKKSLLLFCLICLSLGACAGRVPSPKGAQSLSTNFFQKYGKKYSSSFFGQSQVQKTEINRVIERSKGHAEIESFVVFANGRMARVLMNAQNKPPFGWKIVSWELLESR